MSDDYSLKINIRSDILTSPSYLDDIDFAISELIDDVDCERINNNNIECNAKVHFSSGDPKDFKIRREIIKFDDELFIKIHESAPGARVETCYKNLDYGCDFSEEYRP